MLAMLEVQNQNNAEQPTVCYAYQRYLAMYARQSTTHPNKRYLAMYARQKCKHKCVQYICCVYKDINKKYIYICGYNDYAQIMHVMHNKLRTTAYNDYMYCVYNT